MSLISQIFLYIFINKIIYSGNIRSKQFVSMHARLYIFTYKTHEKNKQSDKNVAY